jgi:hypothetical protein
MRPSSQRWRTPLAWLVMLNLYCSSLPATAQTAVADAGDTSWLCWMAPSAPPVIRCSLEIAYQPAPLTLEQADSSEVLELLHTRFYEGATAEELERLYQLCIETTAADNILTIPLHTIPYEESWREERPQQLLRALLCQKDSPCMITLRKPKN